MKKFATVFLGMQVLLFPQNGFADKPIGYQIDDPHISLFAIRKGDITKLKIGTNNVGAPINFTCKSAAGCLLTVQFLGGTTGAYISVLLDGTPLSPSIGSTFGDKLQSAEVGMGDHTVQIQATASRHFRLVDWEFRFEVYELNN